MGKSDELSIQLKSWLTFFGIWMAEGFVKDKWAVSIAAHKQRVKDALNEVFDKYEWKIRKQKTHDGKRNAWNVCNKQLAKYLMPYSVGAVNKFFPDWVWDLNTKHARWLIHGMMLGDGHWMKNGTMRYDTSSKQLANDFQILCLHAGWATNIMLKDIAGTHPIINGVRYTRRANAWRLTIITKQTNPKVNKNKKVAAHDKMVPYKGKVYCCSVTSGVIYVRREKMPVFSGNSYSGQKGTAGYKPHRSDLPFTEKGLIPDIIFNPNAIGKNENLITYMPSYEHIGNDNSDSVD